MRVAADNKWRANNDVFLAFFTAVLIACLPLAALIIVMILWEKYGKTALKSLLNYDWPEWIPIVLLPIIFLAIAYAINDGSSSSGYDDGVYRSMRGR